MCSVAAPKALDNLHDYLYCHILLQITANPRDINILPDYQNDPRVVSNLVDGINKTRDDIHMWLAPFTETGNHFICLTFTQPSRVALMRIWVSKCKPGLVVYSIARIISEALPTGTQNDNGIWLIFDPGDRYV